MASSALLLDYHPLQGIVTNQNAYQTHYPQPPLNHWVQCFWQLNVPVGQFNYRSVPDNCVDWIISINNPQENAIIAPFLQSREFTLSGPISYFGIRFRILGHQALFPIPASELAGDVNAIDILQMINLQELYDSIFTYNAFADRCKSVSKTLLKSLKQPRLDRRLAQFIRYCYQYYYADSNHAPLRLSDQQCNEFGLSARQLRRLCQLHLGLGPKQFASNGSDSFLAKK